MGKEKWMGFLEKLNSPLAKGKLGVETSTSYHNVMGSPGETLNVIHVAGTNAKGTVCHKLAKMLELSGYKTGLFNSPHLFNYRERVQVNGRLIDRGYCEEFIDTKYADAKQKLGTDISYFDFFTLLGFEYFAHCKVDVAVVEVGLGGRLDSTNILSKSLLSIITSIDLDHTRLLGDTVEKIAGKQIIILAEKCGIIKTGCPTLIGPHVPFNVASEISKSKGSKLYVSERGPNNDFSGENKNLMQKAREIISDQYKITDSAFEESIENYHAPCRLEFLREDLRSNFPLLQFAAFDVGHNPNAIENTLFRFDKLIKGKKYVIVYGSKVAKDYVTSLRIMSDHSQKIYLVKPHQTTAKTVSAVQMFESARENRISNVECVVGEGDIKSTLDHIMKSDVSTGSYDGVLVIGSFTLMRESRSFFGYEDPEEYQ